LNDPVFAEAFKASAGLCLPHLRQGLEEVRDPLALEILLTASRDKLASLYLELAEIIRKNDYRYRGEAFGPEGDAWKRAVVVGSKPIPSDPIQSSARILKGRELYSDDLLAERKTDRENG